MIRYLQLTPLVGYEKGAPNTDGRRLDQLARLSARNLCTRLFPVHKENVDRAMAVQIHSINKNLQSPNRRHGIYQTKEADEKGSVKVGLHVGVSGEHNEQMIALQPNVQEQRCSKHDQKQQVRSEFAQNCNPIQQRLIVSV